MGCVRTVVPNRSFSNYETRHTATIMATKTRTRYARVIAYDTQVVDHVVIPPGLVQCFKKTLAQYQSPVFFMQDEWCVAPVPSPRKKTKGQDGEASAARVYSTTQIMMTFVYFSNVDTDEEPLNSLQAIQSHFHRVMQQHNATTSFTALTNRRCHPDISVDNRDVLVTLVVPSMDSI